MRRLRLRYGVRGKVRFLSSRDVTRVFERALRRAGLRVAYSQGYSPRPRLHFGLALSTGYESDAEYLDIDLEGDHTGAVEPEWVLSALAHCLPRGIEAEACAEIPTSEPSLQEAVTSTAWTALVRRDPVELGERAAAVTASGSHPIQIVRKGKQLCEDLLPLLLELGVTPAGSTADAPPVPGANTEYARLDFELGTKPRSVRPAELLVALGVDEPVLVRRTCQWIQRGPRRFEPLELIGEPPHAQVRAS